MIRRFRLETRCERVLNASGAVVWLDLSCLASSDARRASNRGYWTAILRAKHSDSFAGLDRLACDRQARSDRPPRPTLIRADRTGEPSSPTMSRRYISVHLLRNQIRDYAGRRMA